MRLTGAASLSSGQHFDERDASMEIKKLSLSHFLHLNKVTKIVKAEALPNLSEASVLAVQRRPL